MALPQSLKKLITHLTINENTSVEVVSKLLDHLPGVQLLSGCFLSASDITEMLVGHPNIRIAKASLRFSDGCGDAQEEVVQVLQLPELQHLKKLEINDVDTEEFGKLLKSVDVTLARLESVEIYLNNPSCKALRRVMQFFTRKCPRLTSVVDGMGEARDHQSEYVTLIDELHRYGVCLKI